MTHMVPLFYPLIEDDYRPIPKSDTVLLPKEFAPEDRKLLCAAARSFTRNKAFIGNAVCLTPDQAKANARAAGFKGKDLKDRIKASNETSLFLKFGAIMQQLLLDAEFEGKMPAPCKWLEFMDESKIHEEKTIEQKQTIIDQLKLLEEKVGQ
ncbi:MAG: hypothetical protein ACJZ8C_00025 [Prochlorococcus marinus subsp. pastoris]